MPSNLFRLAPSSVSLPGLSSPASYRPNDVLVSTLSWCAIGEELTGLAASNMVDTTWPSANTAYAYPFELADYFLVRKVWWANGTDATGPHLDVGVYTEAGGLLVSAGDQTAANASRLQEADVTDTLLAPGRYSYACACSTTTGGVLASAAAIPLLRAAGCAQMATAFVLPSTFTPAAISTAFMPLFGIASRLQVA